MVHGTIAYIIGDGSHTMYTYQLDTDKWSKHSKCPHTYPGLVIINDMLTAVGGKKGYGLTNKVVSWKHTEWVEEFPPMHTPRKEPAIMHCGTYVITVGGDCREREVEVLHIPSLLWSTVTSLPRPLPDITGTLCCDSIIAMDWYGSAYMMKIDSLISSIQLEKSPSGHSEWMPLSICPVGFGGPTLANYNGESLVVSYNGIFQRQEKEWMKIGDMPVPMCDCIVFVMCDQVVVVGGRPPGLFTHTDAVRVAMTL